ncbi:hypothetical protein J0H33_13630 [bacterium]|jgi:hypothetical protein|nr:hypothetical protein [bacterium]
MKVAGFLRDFGMFWWDFIVGDSLTLAIGVLVSVGLAFALVHTAPSGVVEVVLPLVVAATLAASLIRR